MISAIVLARNEERNIERCLKSLDWCEEIIVIDDHSVDKTCEIAGKFKAKVIKHPLSGNFSQQRNFGLLQAKGEWVLFIDADEEVSKLLADEIKKEVKTKSFKGFYFKRNDFFMGKWLKHGEIGEIKILRLAEKKTGKWERSVDEIWKIKGETKIFKNPLLHYPHPTLKEFLESINERSTLNADEFYRKGAKLNIFEFFKPFAKFGQNYFFRLGFLDGTQGFVFAILMSLHSFLVRGKIYLLSTKEDRASRKKKRDKMAKLIFFLWVLFVFGSYLFFLFQRGLGKWLSWRF